MRKRFITGFIMAHMGHEVVYTLGISDSGSAQHACMTHNPSHQNERCST